MYAAWCVLISALLKTHPAIFQKNHRFILQHFKAAFSVRYLRHRNLTRSLFSFLNYLILPLQLQTGPKTKRPKTRTQNENENVLTYFTVLFFFDMVLFLCIFGLSGSASFSGLLCCVLVELFSFGTGLLALSMVNFEDSSRSLIMSKCSPNIIISILDSCLNPEHKKCTVHGYPTMMQPNYELKRTSRPAKMQRKRILKSIHPIKIH